MSKKGVVIDLTKKDAGEEEKDEDAVEDNEVPLFNMFAQIVGKQFYKGRMNDGEMIFLEREPRNQYDPNAIRVDSIVHQQVGHISAKDGTANALAPIADRKVNGRIGGTLAAVAMYSHGAFSSIAFITLYGLPEDKAIIAAHLNKHKRGFKDAVTGEPSKYYVEPAVPAQRAVKSPIPTKTTAASTASSSRYQVLTEEEVVRALDKLWDDSEDSVAKIEIKQVDYPALSECLVSALMPHQQQGVAWLLQQELPTPETLPPFYERRVVEGRNTFYHSLTCHDYDKQPKHCLGGFLLDDMGLGKTIQILALILCNPPEGKVFRPLIESVELDMDYPHCNPTLIVCPVSVISSWCTQMEQHLQPGSVKTLVFHGADRAGLTVEDITIYDIVLTTYETLAAGYIEEEPGAKRKSRQGVLHLVNWHRIVLDEAHIIRNMKTLRFKACAALDARHRWCLTGTPIVNSVADLEALIQIVRLEPFCETKQLFSRSITKPAKTGDPSAIAKLRTLMKLTSLKRLKSNIQELRLPPKIETRVMMKFSAAEQAAYNAIRSAIADYMSYLEKFGEANLLRNSSVILALITRLRQCCLDVSLVPAQSLVKLLAFADNGREDSSSSKNAERLSKEEQQSLLDKFKQAFREASSATADARDLEEDLEMLECCICLEDVKDLGVVLRACQHLFCQPCIEKLFERTPIVDCPLCRRKTRKDECISYLDLKALQTPAAAEEGDAEAEVPNLAAPEAAKDSSKTNEILKVIADIMAAEGTRDDKIVIVTSFVSYLTLLKQALTLAGHEVASVTGSMTQKHRAEEIRRFTKDTNVRIVLCSTKAAGVGINLTAGNHIMLADMWWSPAIDYQAIDRVHRIGQTKPVYIYRFVVEDSIDERILGIQKKKDAEMVLTFVRSPEASRKQRLQDFRALLS